LHLPLPLPKEGVLSPSGGGLRGRTSPSRALLADTPEKSLASKTQRTPRNTKKLNLFPKLCCIKKYLINFAVSN